MLVAIPQTYRQGDGSLVYRYAFVETRRCFVCSPERHREVFAVTAIPRLPGRRVVVHACRGSVTKIVVAPGKGVGESFT